VVSERLCFWSAAAGVEQPRAEHHYVSGDAVVFERIGVQLPPGRAARLLDHAAIFFLTQEMRAGPSVADGSACMGGKAV
jgi:hypothetical protein